MAAAGSNRHAASDARYNGANGPVGGIGGTAGGGTDGMTRFTIPSDFTRGREIQTRILDDVARHHYPSDTTFGIKLALEEALVNAIKHGNKLDATKKVQIEYAVTPQQVEISIEDEGPGFDRASVPDPTDPANLEKCSGRGILLIEAYMTTVRWSNSGRRVHMMKKND